MITLLYTGFNRTVTFSQWIFIMLQFGRVKFDEEFIAWDTNSRVTFSMVSSTRPVFMNFRAVLEDMYVESLHDGTTKFTYSVYVEPSFLVGMIGCIIYPTLSNMFKNATANFKTYMEHVTAETRLRNSSFIPPFMS